MDLPRIPENDNDHEDDASSVSTFNEDVTDPSSFLDNDASPANAAEREKRKKAFIEREEQHVRNARRSLAVAILICAVVVSASVFVLYRRSEQRSFTREFEIFTADIISNVQWENNYNFALMEKLSDTVTSYAISLNATFPNVTIPHFEIEAGYVNGLGGMIACAYAPFVLDSERKQWEDYSLSNVGWVNESLMLREIHKGHQDPFQGTKDDEGTHETSFQGFDSIKEKCQDKEEENYGLEVHFVGGGDALCSKRNYSKSMYHWKNGTVMGLEEQASTMYAPIWQVTPPVPMAINSDLLSDQVFQNLYTKLRATNHTVISPPAAVGQIFDFLFDQDHILSKLEPHSFIAAPVYESFSDQKIIGMIVGLTPFYNLLDFLFDDTVKDIIVVVTNDCGSTTTFDINGPNVSFLGYEDLHDPSYDEYKKSAHLEVNRNQMEGLCHLDFHIYPTSALKQSYETTKPYFYAGIVLLSFFLTSVLITLYDSTVTKRQEKTMRSALQSGALVASLFPATVHERLLASPNDFANVDDGGKLDLRSRPIADFFPNTTIMFADIAGFTAWSSTREPFQVFELLETIYGAFDELAKRRRIFKVETVGDCYVAVSGIPEARADHAIVMAKFARDCLYKMKSVTKLLEVKLGPDTSALAFRVGLHSGPVTGGVLRGDNARFQLFGDTVNTAARMESTGIPNMIQVSQTTADLLIAASKEHWIKPRDEQVFAKGKGHMTTYWLSFGNDRSCSKQSTSSRSQASEGNENSDNLARDEIGADALNNKTKRLVDWNVQVLLRFLKQIVARRGRSNDLDNETDDDWNNVTQPNVAVVDEVAEIIALPTFSSISETETALALINEEVELQLHEYVSSIAKLYRNNHFHNFEHASHVTMSVVKLMGRIVPTSLHDNRTKTDSDALALHDHTYGITSDPLTQFACIFAALIHDVDHHGVSNMQLVQEQDPVAVMYDGNSVLEQNSVVVAWNLIMEPKFKALRMTLCATSNEAKRFRQLVVNAVMATDIMAPDLKAARNNRWSKAFAEFPLVEDPSDTINRKATIVIDHMIQASDVCHTMQHWHVYRKWNERLFMEMTKAYKEGRAEKNPADTWYQGEIGFFDYYVIPLAKKLADCGVFGVSSDEYLIYATKNRDEWEARGEEMVREMVEQVETGDQS